MSCKKCGDDIATLVDSLCPTCRTYSEETYPNARDCEHGQLRRSCDKCQDAAEIVALSSEVAELRAAAEEHRRNEADLLARLNAAKLDYDRGVDEARRAVRALGGRDAVPLLEVAERAAQALAEKDAEIAAAYERAAREAIEWFDAEGLIRDSKSHDNPLRSLQTDFARFLASRGTGDAGTVKKKEVK